MKKAVLTAFFVVFSAVAEAQTPATVHAQWAPNPTTDNVVQYLVTLDVAAPVVVLPAACTAALCSQILTVPAFGLHTVTIVAQNLKLSTDPTSLQSGPAATVTFSLGSLPVVVSGARIVN